MRLSTLTRPVILFLAASALIDMGIYGIMDVLLNFFYRSMGFDLGQIGLLQGAQRMGALVFSLPAGLIIARLGARRMLIISAVGLMVSLVAMTLSPAFAWHYGVRVLMGAMYTSVFIASIPLVATLTGRDGYTAVFSWQFIAVSLAVAIANSIGGRLPGLLYSLFPALDGAETTGAYAGSLIIAALVAGAGAIPLLMLPKSPPTAAATAPRSQNAPWGRILLMSAPMFIFGIGAGLSIPYYNLFFRDTFRLSDATIGTIFTLGAVAMLIVTLVVPGGARRFGQSRMLMLMMVATSAAFLGLSLAPGVELTIVFYMLALALRNTMSPLYNPLLLDYVEESQHGLISSVSTGAWSLGFFVVTLFAGDWVEAFGYRSLFQMTALTTLGTGLIALFVFQTLRPVRVPQPAAQGAD